MPGQDYRDRVLIVDFPPGVPSVSVPVVINNDRRVEPLIETFKVQLVTPIHGIIDRINGIPEATIYIEDNDSNANYFFIIVS